jgi:hypothetical protein
MTPRGSKGLPDRVREDLDKGCQGLCSAYQGYDAVPEFAPNTKCYLAEALAKSRRCPCGYRNFVFAKQGRLNKPYKGTTIVPGKGGVVPNDLISSENGFFNYVIWFPSTKSYVWMDHTVRQGPQTIFIRKRVEYDDPSYPNTMWCSTCRR